MIQNYKGRLKAIMKGFNKRERRGQEALANNPLLLELENIHRYESQTLAMEESCLNTIESIQKNIDKSLFVAKNSIREDKDY